MHDTHDHRRQSDDTLAGTSARVVRAARCKSKIIIVEKSKIKNKNKNQNQIQKQIQKQINTYARMHDTRTHKRHSDNPLAGMSARSVRYTPYKSKIIIIKKPNKKTKIKIKIKKSNQTKKTKAKAKTNRHIRAHA